MDARVTINKTGMDRLLRSRSGPLALHVANVGRQVAAGARQRAPLGKTGDLKDSIDFRMVRTSTGWTAEIVADAPHAAFVHEGTRPHPIFPRKRHGLLVFDVGNETVFVRGPVNHPGTKPRPFLREAAAALGLRVRRR